MKTFRVGDIVEHSSGRICNGRYASITLDWDNVLMVLDNEGAPDMMVKGNEEDLTVVGNVYDNPYLLEVFTFEPKGTFTPIREKRYEDPNMKTQIHRICHSCKAVWKEEWSPDEVGLLRYLPLTKLVSSECPNCHDTSIQTLTMPHPVGTFAPIAEKPA